MGPGTKPSDGGRFSDDIDSLFDGRHDEDEQDELEEEEE
jgi:hypothetical protein